MFDGMEVRVDSYLCRTEFLRWKKTHHRSRIRKKWRKRYGPVMKSCPGFAYQVALLDFDWINPSGYPPDRFLVVCPCMMAKLERETPASSLFSAPGFAPGALRGPGQG